MSNPLLVDDSRVIRLIAWLSLCLLGAAWCPMLDDGCRIFWAHGGLFGLIAAIGLESAENSRVVRRLLSMTNP
ncbi:MAG: hypothetical protein WD847_04490 [Pirellulales bacterium]